MTFSGRLAAAGRREMAAAVVVVTMSVALAMPPMPGRVGPRWPGRVDRPQPARALTDQPNEVLVLIADFSDNTQSHGKDDFEQLLFGTGGHSMRDYYIEVSDSNMTITGLVAGWFRMDQTYSYYLGDSFGIFGDFPHNSQGLVRDLVQKADASVDFSRYDHDLDGVVDDLLIVHAGPGAEETGDPRNVWSHKWEMSDRTFGSTGPVPTQDGVSIDPFSIEPERFADGSLVSIGVFCHEYGHQLGMPDLYDTDYSGNGLGLFCLMAAGSWARASESDPPGSSPVHPCAWNKYLLGWCRPDSLEPGLVDSIIGAELPAVATSAGAFRLLRNPGGVDWNYAGNGEGEYFMVENRERTGFDQGLPGSGLLILHVDESREANYDEKHPLVGILQADGSAAYALPSGDVGSGSDLWKSSDDGVSNLTIPSTAYYDGVQSGVVVSRISAAGAVMTADLRIAPLFLGRVFSFPNPVIVRSTSDRLTIVYEPTDSTRLAGQYPDFTVRIYNLAGEPVRLLDDASEVNAQHRAAYWDLKNNQGRPATSGLYFYTVDIDQQGVMEQNIGRLTVIR